MRRPGVWVSRRLWEQEGMDLAGARVAVAAAEDGEMVNEGEEEER